MQIVLLADRLRVEERQLIDAFATRGHEAVLVAPARMHIALMPPATAESGMAWGEPVHPGLAIERGEASKDREPLVTLLSAAGIPVINRPATVRLLTDRLALLRHLVFAGIPVPDTVISFGEEATYAAIEQLGYPVLLKAIDADPAIPVALIEDRDAAEAVVEHRTTLGNERGVLIQRFLTGPTSIRLPVVGRDLVDVEMRPHHGWRPRRETAYEPFTGDHTPFAALANRVVERLGSGCYSIEVIESASGPVVVGVENLVDFRSLQSRGTDVAGAIVDFALSQLDGQPAGQREGERRG